MDCATFMLLISLFEVCFTSFYWGEKIKWQVKLRNFGFIKKTHEKYELVYLDQAHNTF